MEQICKKELCTGCGACSNACSHHAIDIITDKCGYLYPTINNDICVDCGLCLKVCPVNNPPAFNTIEKCYAATCKSEDELISCSSGGVATAISRYIISNSGVVYGCSAKDIRNVHHIRVDNEDGLEDLKGSKYVQSVVGGIYAQVKQDLLYNRKVLFIGTPCQVAGLYGYLRTKFDHLYTIDLVCHGVPSQKMLNDNIAYYPSDESRVSFRRKRKNRNGYRIEFGWNRVNTVTGKSQFIAYNRDFYMFGFLRCLTFRENCYTCAYASNKRVADITLCDFWGLSPDAGFELGKGVSAILVSTEKGIQIVEAIKYSLNIKKREVIEATKWNEQLNYPSRKPKRYSKFVSLYSKHTFRCSMLQAYFLDYLYDIYIVIKNRIKRIIKKYYR